MALAVFGLGNPGERYEDTRHNVGFRVVEELASRLDVSFKKRLFRSYWQGKAVWRGKAVYLVKPITFMNSSGRIVPEVLRETGLSVEEMLVVCDSLDLTAGNCRFRPKGSSGGHKGLESIIHHVGTDSFMRLTIGIGRPGHRGEVVNYVLGQPRGAEAALIEQGISKAVDAVFLLISDGPSKVMNEINRKEPPS